MIGACYASDHAVAWRQSDLLFISIVFYAARILMPHHTTAIAIAMLAAVVDSIIFGRQLARLVAERFPKGDGSGLSVKPRPLGFYAFNRACLPRRWRVPRPRVKRRDAV